MTSAVPRPRLTVITPSLNQATYLERTLRSVLDQGYPDLEYIVVDGGSTDGSVDILRRYDDQLAYWVSEPDAGQSWAINRGIERSTGEIIAYINSDDYYLPGAFEAALPLFSEASVRWVAGATEYVFADGELENLWVPRRPRGLRAAWIRRPWYVPQASSFWRRDVFDEFGLLREDLHFIFDTEFGLRVAIGGVRPNTLEQTLAVRYQHDAAKSADRTRFEAEWAPVADGFRKQLSRWEPLADDTLQALWKPQYLLRKRLGLLGLRRRWLGGRFLRQ